MATTLIHGFRLDNLRGGCIQYLVVEGSQYNANFLLRHVGSP